MEINQQAKESKLIAVGIDVSKDYNLSERLTERSNKKKKIYKKRLCDFDAESFSY